MASLTVWVQCATVPPACYMAIENLAGLSALSLPHLLRGLLPAIEVKGWLDRPWSEFHVGSLSFRREAGHRMWKEALPTLSPLDLEQTYPKSQGCSALCVLVPTAPSVLHSPFINSFNKQGPACFPGYRRRKQCGTLVELMQARYPQLPLPSPKAQRP